MLELQDTFTIQNRDKYPQNIKLVIAVWNLKGLLPPHNSVKLFIDKITRGMINIIPDIFCIATQQCQRSICLSFFCQNKNEWQNILIQCAKGYQMVDTLTMNAMHIALFVKNDLIQYYSTKKKLIMKAGFCNCIANKGAISLTINFFGKNFQFINCHLQPHQNSNRKRNQVLINITQKMVQKNTKNQVFICGDLNYRIEMTHEQYKQLVNTKQNTEKVMRYIKMLDRDQLTNQKILQRYFLPYYQQSTINFPPTYKISQNGPQYNKKRIPGWTDRIFYRKGKAKQIGYQCMYDLYGSDHRPVLGSFNVRTDENYTVLDDQEVGMGKSQGGCLLI